MENFYLDQNGKLKEAYLPAIYFDASVLIEYYKVEGSEIDYSEIEPELAEIEAKIAEQNKNQNPIPWVIQDILKTGKNISKMIEIRKKFWDGDTKARGIASPFALIEMCEWYSEVAFKDIASEVSGYKFLQKKSKKDIGDYLKKILDLYRDKKQKSSSGYELKGLKDLLDSLFLNGSFVRAHGLADLLLVDIVNFSIPTDKVWCELMWHSYLQIGLADILHIALAQHLGCQYFASFDSDFKRLFDAYGDLIGMKLLNTPDELLSRI